MTDTSPQVDPQTGVTLPPVPAPEPVSDSATDSTTSDAVVSPESPDVATSEPVDTSSPEPQGTVQSPIAAPPAPPEGFVESDPAPVAPSEPPPAPVVVTHEAVNNAAAQVHGVLDAARRILDGVNATLLGLTQALHIHTDHRDADSKAAVDGAASSLTGALDAAQAMLSRVDHDAQDAVSKLTS